MFISCIQLAILLFCIHLANTDKSCPGDCVPPQSCSDALAMLRNPRIPPIDMTNRMRESACSVSPVSGLKVCCSDFKIFTTRLGDTEDENDAPIFSTSTSESTTTTTTTTTSATPSTTTTEPTTEPTTTRLSEHPNMKLLPDTCGEISNVWNRIVGGEIASLYDFPWMALIGYKAGDNLTVFSCSGTLINPNYVLTAAHCIKNTIMGVRIGEYDMKNKKDCDNFVCDSEVQDFDIEDIITHPKFALHPYLTHDIALIRLQGSVNMTYSNVGTICLPVTPFLRDATITGKQATVLGWGVTEHNKESSILRRVDVPVSSYEKCRNIYSKISEANFTIICAGGYHRDSCRGDSGGPLVITDVYKSYEHSYIQFGIVSQGSRICGNGQLAIYTDVRLFVDWILDNIRE